MLNLPFTFLFLLGSIVGSFLNVVIYRLPLGLSIVTPRSFCPHCKHSIPFYRNIPILSFLIQRGKCHECKENISLQYPIIELISGIIWLYGLINYPLEEGLLFIFMTSILLMTTMIDFKHFYIPLSFILFMLIGLIGYHVLSPYGDYRSIYGGLVPTLYLGTVMGITGWIFKKQTMGYGDLQLVFVCGIWLGAVPGLIMIFFSALFSLIFWAYLIYKSKVSRDSKLPFASFIAPTTILVYTLDFNFFL